MNKTVGLLAVLLVVGSAASAAPKRPTAKERAKAQCVAALEPVETNSLISSVPRTEEEVQAAGKILSERLVEILKDTKTVSVELAAQEELIAQYEPFRQVSERFLLSREGEANVQLIQNLALLKSSSVAIQTRIAAMNVILSPSLWQKTTKLQVMVPGLRDKKKEKLADEIQTCRTNLQNCLSSSQVLLDGRKSDLASAKAVITRVDEEIAILSLALRDLELNSALPRAGKDELIGVINLQQQNFSLIRTVLIATRESLESEISVALQIVNQARDIVHHQIQLLAVAGAPTRILRDKPTADLSAINEELVLAFNSSGMSDKARIGAVDEFLLESKAISDRELLYILEKMPRGMDWGHEEKSRTALHKQMDKEGLTNWKEDEIWLALDIEVMRIALNKTTIRTLADADLVGLSKLTKEVLHASQSYSKREFSKEYLEDIELLFEKLTLKILKLKKK